MSFGVRGVCLEGNCGCDVVFGMRWACRSDGGYGLDRVRFECEGLQP